MQSCLEKRGIDERNAELVRSDYGSTNEYNASHKDAVSDGDAQGKGTNHGGHTHWLPDCTKPVGYINRSNFDTTDGGGLYDIKGRNGIGGREKALASSMYNEEYQYGANLIDTSLNINEGQFIVS